MDKKLYSKLIDKINKQGGINSKRLSTVTLEDFFEGNDDESSIGCNLMDHPGIQTFYSVLKDIRKRENVQDVSVDVYEIEEGCWPFSETVFILTNAKQDEIEKWVEVLEPSDIMEYTDRSFYRFLPKLKQGYKYYSLWWD